MTEYLCTHPVEIPPVNGDPWTALYRYRGQHCARFEIDETGHPRWFIDRRGNFNGFATGTAPVRCVRHPEATVAAVVNTDHHIAMAFGNATNNYECVGCQTILSQPRWLAHINNQDIACHIYYCQIHHWDTPIPGFMPLFTKAQTEPDSQAYLDIRDGARPDDPADEDEEEDEDEAFQEEPMADVFGLLQNALDQAQEQLAQAPAIRDLVWGTTQRFVVTPATTNTTENVWIRTTINNEEWEVNMPTGEMRVPQ